MSRYLNQQLAIKEQLLIKDAEREELDHHFRTLELRGWANIKRKLKLKS